MRNRWIKKAAFGGLSFFFLVFTINFTEIQEAQPTVMEQPEVSKCRRRRRNRP